MSIKISLLFLAISSSLPALLQAQDPVISIDELLKPQQIIEDFSVTTPPSIQCTITSEGEVELSGDLKDGSGTVVLEPNAGHWDISKFAYFRVDITNNGDGLVWVRGRLDNANALDWSNSSSSMAYILPGERATLGFPFQRMESADDSPEIFHLQGARPNGFRLHWLKFNPERVMACRLILNSASGRIALNKIQVSLSQPYGADANKHLLGLPYLDRFGQVRQLDWPNKLHGEAELIERAREEMGETGAQSGPERFNRFGGWGDGPQLEATGFFRVEKYKGRWWFVDPDGRLFFSHGANSVGFAQQTPVTDRESLFEWIPSETDLGEALSDGNLKFMVSNLHRTFGPDWQDKAYDRIHSRMRQWGMNTVGAWSDSYLYLNPKTPYTPILHVSPGKNRLAEKLPDPFSADFEQRVEDGLRKLAVTAGSDPLCLGVFIDNELGWYEDFVGNALAGPADMPARIAVFEFLKEKYASIDALNAAWSTEYESWETLSTAPVESGGYAEDRKALERLIANRYYEVCHEMMRKVFPNHLYLGSRIHKASPEVYEEATRYADVLSVNRYMPLPVTGLPKHFDKPCLIAEFHFGAPDRGVPGVGLTFVGDQVQRSRAYAAYVLDAVLQPNIVGTHWFAYPDQSAAARPTVGKPGENYQIGFVDVTDTPYPEITETSRRLSEIMYPLADEASPEFLPLLDNVLRTPPSTTPTQYLQ